MAAYDVEDIKGNLLLDSTTLNTGGTATVDSTNSIDCTGKAWAKIFIDIGAIAGGGSLSALALLASSTSGGTYSLVSGGDLATSNTLSKANIENKQLCINVRLTGKNPFLKVRATTAAAVNSVITQIYAISGGSQTVPPASTGFTYTVNV